MEEILSFSANKLIFSEGEEASGLFIIQSGEIICLKNNKDRLTPIYRARAGDIIGESALLSDAPHIYSAITLNDCSVVKVSSTNFVTALNEAPNWVQDLTRTMISRFQNTSDLLAQNRILHDSILSEEDYPPTRENEFKKILTSKD